MRELRLLLRFIEKDYLPRLIFVLLLYSLVPLAEIFFFLYLGELAGNYLVLVLAAVAGLPGVPIALSELQRTLPRLREKIRQGRPHGREFADIAGILAGSILLVTPGFITDVLGYLLLVPAMREALVQVLLRRLRRSYPDLHQYLKLNGIEPAAGRG